MPKNKIIPNIPKEITVEITNDCNLNCQICLLNKAKKTYLSFAKIKKIINEAASLGIEAIRITGGEPLLHKDLFKILKYIKSKKFYLILNTNGTLLNPKLIKKLEKYLDNILVSLQGYNSASEEKLTGKNFFSQKVKNLAKLAYSNINMVRVDTIVSRTLIENLPKYKLILTTIGIKTWVTNRPMLTNNGPQNNEYNISKKDFLKVMNFMKNLKKNGINANLGNSVPFCITTDSKKLQLLTSNRLTEGYQRIVYDIGGFYKPTYKINVNIGKNLEQALKNSFLKKIKSYKFLPDKCQKCKFLQTCLGGSRFLAKKNNGDYFGPDPWMER